MKTAQLKSKLAESAKKLGLRMPQVQLLLAQERFLFRVASVDQDSNLIWKGGSLILRKYSQLKPPRFTTDIDFTSRRMTIEQVVNLLEEAMEVDLNDGFRFLKLNRYPMERDTPYGGERFEIDWEFNEKKNSESLRIDICAGDDVDSKEILLNEVYLLDDDTSKATVSIYPPEFVIAEKLETLVRFGTGNTRLKDFIDLWTLGQLPDTQLSRFSCTLAIRRCFLRRETPLDPKYWEDVLNDIEFQELMEEARKRNFPKLSIPEISEVFSFIKSFLKTLGPF